jgi:hypothetical protein
MRGFAQDAYDATFDNGALNSYTDDRRVDELLPEHPLSRARRWLARLEPSILLTTHTPPLPLIVDEDPPPASSAATAARRTIWYLYESANRPDLLKAARWLRRWAVNRVKSALCGLSRSLDNKAGHHRALSSRRTPMRCTRRRWS